MNGVYRRDVRRFVLSLILVLTSCDMELARLSGDPPEQGAWGSRGSYRDADTLVIGRATDALDLDPARPTDNESIEIIEQIFDKLVHFRPGSNEVLPGLAVSWTPEDGGRAWVFELRRGVTFHDGTPLDADAVVFSLARQMDPAHPYHRGDFTYWKNYFANVLAVDKVDEYRVRITVERPYAPFLANMGIFSVSIVSPTAVMEHGDEFTRHPVGTGPFSFVSWDNGRVVLERNDSYWGRAPRVRRLVFQTIADHRERLVALESGAVDIIHGVPPDELQFVRLHPHLRLYRAEANSITYLAMNNAYPPFDDARVRRAINYAVNKEAIVSALWQGMAEVARSPLPPAQWGHYVVREPYRYDPNRARALLDEARADGRFDPARVLRFYVPSSSRLYLPSPERLGRAIQANLSEIGIETRLIVQPISEHIASLAWGEHDLALYGWLGDNGDPDNFLYLLLDRNNTEPGRASNVAFFRDPEVHGLLSIAQESERKDERVSLYARAQALIHEGAPWVPLAHPPLVLAARDDIGGIRINPSGVMDYEDIFRIPAEPRSGKERADAP